MFNNIKDKVTQYINIRFEELRLEVFERIVNVLGIVIFAITSLLFLSLSFIFLGFSLASYLGKLMNSLPLGYLSTFGIFFLIGILLLAFSKPIIKFFAGRMIVIMAKKKTDAID